MACLIYMYWLANTHKSQSNLSDMLTCLLYIIVHLPQFVFDKLRSTLKFYMLRLYMLLLRLRAVVHKKKIMMGNNVFVCVCVCVFACMCMHECVCVCACICGYSVFHTNKVSVGSNIHGIPVPRVFRRPVGESLMVLCH